MARNSTGLLGATALVLGFSLPSTTGAAEVSGYSFSAAAQEITQLFWLADTANVCGWAADEETARFKSFSVRFLAAHLADSSRLALLTLVTESGYEDKVRRVALDGAHDNCSNRRWHMGWLTYKKAADENDAIF